MKKYFFLVFLFVGSFAVANSSKISSEVQALTNDGSRANVILVLQEQADVSSASLITNRNQRIQTVYDRLRKLALRTQKPITKVLLSEGLKFRSYYLVNSIAIENATSTQLNRLASLSAVAHISLDKESKLSLPPVNVAPGAKVDPYEIPDNLKKIGIEQVWQAGNFGKGIVIAGQDSGFKWDHPALKQQYRGFNAGAVDHNYNWHDAIHAKIGGGSSCGYNLAAPCDDSSHGTHTMGTMVGYDWVAKTNRIGLAPEAKWMGCRSMDKGVGRASTYLECFEYFLAPYAFGADPKLAGKPEYAPHIINNSWACTTEEGCVGGEFERAIDVLQAAGIIVVASAGNDGPGCGTIAEAPGSYSGKIFSVAAYDHRNNSIAFFSSRGPSKWNGGVGPNISAPGNGIRSAVPSGGVNGGSYDYKSGTSMAGPHVAGAIALLWSARPELIGKIDATLALLQKTATPKTTSQDCGAFKGSQIPNAVFGYGLMDIGKAIQTPLN